MGTIAETRVVAPWLKLAAWLPVVVLPLGAVWFAAKWPSWVFMWVMAISIYAGLKWLTLADCVRPSQPTVGRTLGYLLFWPGMDAKSFFANRQAVERPSLREWCFAVTKLGLGAILIVAAAALVRQHPVISAWVGMMGIVFTLHFGLFHLVSVCWRRAGVDAPPIMNSPILASSLGDFWGKRWNLAFRDLTHRYVFRPLVTRFGIAVATMAVFLVSGIVHDAVVSIPARGGFGLPTVYFLVQGAGVLFERSRVGKRIGIRRSVIGRVFCAAVTMGPVALLFHQPFVERAVVPLFIALGSTWNWTMNLELLILIGGILHFGILLASAMVPKVLDWKASLNQLDGLSRQLVWVHGAFIVLVIVGFGLLSVLFASDLVNGTPLARGVCLFIALFWAARLVVQFFVFDAKPYLHSAMLKIGYHGLTVVFVYHAVVYSVAAILPGR